MNVHLTPELEQFLQTKLDSGRYNSASELVSEALLLMQQNDQFRALHLQELRNHMDIALSQSARGEGTNGEQFMQDMLQDLDTVAEIVKPSAKRR